jgi:hypothetical protein
MQERVVFSDFSFLFFFNVSFVYSRSFRELALMNPYIRKRSFFIHFGCWEPLILLHVIGIIR